MFLRVLRRGRVRQRTPRSPQHRRSRTLSPESARANLPVVNAPISTAERDRIVTAICTRIANGGRVHAACDAEGIRWATLWEWKATNRAYAAQYAQAREASADHWAEKGTDTVEAPMADAVAVQVARVRESHYRWRASTANPKDYGDQLRIEPADSSVSAVFLLPARDAPLIPPTHGAIIERTERVLLGREGAAELVRLLDARRHAGAVGSGEPAEPARRVQPPAPGATGEGATPN